MGQNNNNQVKRVPVKRRKQISKTKKIIIISAIVVGVAALVMLGIFIYHTVINPSAAFAMQVVTPDPQQSTSSSQGPDETPLQVDQSFMQGRVNILVMGMDASKERFESAREDFRTDTMLLVTINFNTGKVDMITTPRDSYVTVTKATGDLYKVNSAAYFGGGLCDSGFQNACDTISGVFGGIPVSYYIGVDMDGLQALVDAMGGVDYDVDIVFTGQSGQEYTKGMQHLDSTQVLDYMRERKSNGTDVNRQERQRNMLIAIFKQLANSGQIKNLPNIYQSLKDMVYTNLSFEQICALAVFGAGFDDWNDIGQYTLKGEYHTAYGVYYYLLDQQAKADLVKQIFGVDIGIDEKHDLHYVLKDKHNKNANKPEPSDSEDKNGDSGDEPTTTNSQKPSDETVKTTPAPSEEEPSAPVAPTTAPTKAPDEDTSPAAPSAAEPSDAG